MSIKLKPFNERVVVILGASSGIGLTTAGEAAKRGAQLVLAARSERTLGEVVDRLKQQGAEAIAVACDVSDRAQCNHVAEVAIETFGRIDTWVNNAGIAIYGRLDKVSEEDSRRMFDTNFWGIVNGSLAAMPHLRDRGGALIGGALERSSESTSFAGKTHGTGGRVAQKK